MDFVALALAILKFVNLLMDYVNREQLMQAGRDDEIAKITQAILIKTTAGKAIMERVNAMPDKEVDDGLRNLEPRGS